ncbi:unnamed protein product [Dracunculus medinensis]|uniref:Gustatory receptor n=1 Tax=Dracunculus medinensis TaxID=318479 RepID=A0A0N4UBC5_DRAME|nr:unnamed protein product [Dracunculus medinensis]
MRGIYRGQFCLFSASAQSSSLALYSDHYAPLRYKQETASVYFFCHISCRCFVVYLLYFTLLELTCLSGSMPFITFYIQSYVVQQLCCASLALIMAIVQSVLQKRSTRIINITIVVMNSCQLAQELAHAWSTYYVCIYMKSVAVHVDSNLLFDQVMISITLLIHGCRLILCALVTASLSGYAFEEEMLKRIIFQPDPDRLVSVAQAAQASRHDELCSLFLFLESVILALAYIALDISYFTLNITRRTLTASTGISLFYALFLALSFHIYRRDHITIALKVGCVFAIILLNCSLHTIYMFGEEFLIGTLNIKLFSVDLIIAVYSTFIAIHCLRFNTRTILTHTVLQSQPSCISALLKMLNHLATINFLTLTLEFSLILIMKVGWKMNDPSINFGIHDWISVLSTFVLQKWVCLYERYQSCLLILILQLVVECITTLSFLSAQTNYIQLMISLARSNANINRLRQLLPVDHIIIILVYTDHSLQVLQWAISLCSLGFSLIVLNEIVVDKNETNGDLHPTVAVTNEPHMAPKNEPISINGLNGFNNNAFEDDTIQIVEIEPSGLTTNTENVA